MLSERLRYHPVEPANLDAFHRLVQDEHVRRYMMDGNAFSRDCGFGHAPGRSDPQLIYAMFERFTGRGFGTEMARAAIAQARSQPGFAEVEADVDEINAASVRVLEKLGFERTAVLQGAFGSLLLLRLPAGR